MNYLSLAAWILSAIIFLLTIAVAAVVVSENRNPVRSLAWLTVLLVVPVFGLVLYFVFGRDIRTRRAVTRRMKRKLRRQEKVPRPDLRLVPISQTSKGVIRVADKFGAVGLHHGNSATHFVDGGEKMKSLFEDISRAENYIYLQYYIIEDDSLGEELARRLTERARAGVKVYVIFDPVGSVGTSRNYFRQMEEAEIKVKPFIPVRFPGFGTRINWRNHRKQVVIDGRVAYIGGMNIARRYVDGGKEFNSWRDLHLRVEGSVVSAVETSFITDWSFMGDDYEELLHNVRPPVKKAGDLSMQFVTSGPTSQWYHIEMLFLKAIGGATKRIFIETPYFLPTEALVNALQAAALSGVDVRIMMPERSDSLILTSASASYVGECLRAGIKIYYYTPGMLHSKMMIVDDELVTIGSTNFDYRSFEHNFEGNLFIYSGEFNSRLTAEFFSGLKQSERVIPEEWASRGWRRRLSESVLRLLAPIL